MIRKKEKRNNYNKQHEQEAGKMKRFVKLTMVSTMLIFSILFSRESAGIKAEINPTIMNDGKEYTLTQSDNHTNASSREEIILWEEDFESGENGWSLESGWSITTSSYNSENHSALSPDNDANMNSTHNILSPIIDLPSLGDGETMNFGFWLWADQPDTDSDGDDYLDDYYAVSVLDLAALAWHSSDMNSGAIGGDGNSFWAADEEVGGYLDSWIQYLDTPSISIGSGGSFEAKIFYAIEDPGGAVVGGSCTDGWDAANIRISTDGGATWDLLEDGTNPYHFDCGYGWIWNDAEYEEGGSLNHLAAGWGGQSSRWKDFSADLSAYAGEDVIIRFAFGSDPAWSTMDDSSITGFQVDGIMVSDSSGELFSDNGDDMSQMSVSGEVWVDQFYDYGSCDDDRPGCSDWEEYVPGMPFNGNVFLDISDFAEKSVVFRFQSRYDEDNAPSGQGAGFHIDDFKIYKISGGNYPAPMGLTAEPGDGEVMLSWSDMNASGTEDFVYHNGNITSNGGISLTEAGTAWAGERFDVFGPSTVNSVSVYSINTGAVDVTIAGFGQLGTLFGTDPSYSMNVILQPGENTFNVDWEMTNSFIIGHTFTDVILAGLDTSPNSVNSMVFLGGGWDPWSDYEDTIIPGEWGISANITYDGANVTYNVYRDGASVASGFSISNHTDSGLTNNVTYEYTVSATYDDGEESDESNTASSTPFADTVHEEGYDDGSFESEFNAGSGNFSAVRFSAASAGEDIVRFKWFQNGSGGAFYIKVFEDEGGMPGAEVYSTIQASGNVDGWNDKDLSLQGLSASGDFWVGTKEFSSSNPFGLDTSGDTGNSYQRIGASGDWTAVSGNIAYHIYLDCGDNCDDDSCTNDAGDVNEDGTVNILDIVSLANYVLGGSLSDCGSEGADMNGDGTVNILDIVAVVNVILGGRTDDATSAEVLKTDDAFLVTADGYIGGIQMTLVHDGYFSINLTDDALLAKYHTEGNKTTLVVVVPENDEIFSYTGDFEITEMIIANSTSEVTVNTPNAFELGAAYPNPFNPSTSISLHLPMESDVSVQVYDLSGRMISTLLSGVQAQGDYNLTWNAQEQASGMYLVRAETAGSIAVQKILLLK